MSPRNGINQGRAKTVTVRYLPLMRDSTTIQRKLS
jgi:hypothetical protein